VLGSFSGERTERLDRRRVNLPYIPYVQGGVRRVVLFLPSIRSLLIMRRIELPSDAGVRFNVDNGSPWAHSQGFHHPFHCWIIPAPAGNPGINLGCSFPSIRFRNKTPEESDGFSTPRENPPKCHIPGGNKSLFSTRFHTSGQEYSCSGMCGLGLF